jgi:hypothetical protein
VFLAFTVVQQIMTELSAATEKEKVAVITKAMFTLLKTMPATVYRPLKITAFNAARNCTGRQVCEVRKQLRDLKIDVALFSDTPQTSYGVLHSELR